MKKYVTKLFIARSENNQWLPFLRVTVALLALIQFIAVFPDFTNIFTFEGYVKPDVLDAVLDNYSPTMYDIYLTLQEYVKGLSYNDVLYGISTIYIVSLILLVSGLFTRFAACTALLGQLTIIKSIHFYQYGVDFFTTILLFYCVVFPVGKILSLDNRRLRRADLAGSCSRYLRLFQIHICIVYCISGFDKMMGFSWQNGEAVWKATTAFNQLGIIDFREYAKYPILFTFIGWATIVAEMFYPVFINIRKTRLFWLTITILMHLGIALVMGLFFFSSIMIIFNLVAYYVPYLKPKESKMPFNKERVLQPT